jgi:hypothetical protein
MSRSFARAAVAGTLAFGALVASSTSAQAQQGELNFIGSANINDPNSAPGGNTLFIDFLTAGVTGPADGSILATETISGVFDPEIAMLTPGTIRDLELSPGVVGTPITNFVSIGGYNFTLMGTGTGNAFGPISLRAEDNGNGGFNTVGSFSVFGSVTGGDFGMTPAMFTGVFTTQFTNMTPDEVYAQIDAGRVLTQGYSATFSVQNSVVPEPSTYLLMATGLGMIGMIGYRRRNNQA